MTAPAAAFDALARMDDGEALAADREIAAVFDRHASGYWHRVNTRVDAWQAVCRHGHDADCNSCFLDHEVTVSRSEDI